ncbi:MAG TPA: sensor histidine kinase [Pseudonocardiaceae bacterium]
MRARDELQRGWVWPDWTFGKTPTTRRERFGAAAGPSIFLVFLIQPVSEAFSPDRPGWWRAAVIATVVAYSAAYTTALARGNTRRLPHRERAWWIAGLSVFPILLAVELGPDALVFATYVVSAGLMCLPRNAGALVGFGFALALAIGTRMASGAVDWTSVWVLGVLTLSMFAFNALIAAIRQLKAAQVEMAKMAVTEERSRLARDLHDVLGHSLTTITVKAGLARRVLESSTDRERAIAEVRDVEELARQAMAEVRATVSGYRTPSLAAELVGARAALQATGIAADLPQAVDNVAAGLHEAFAYVVREGVTNVVRHSGATRCEVRLGENWVEVRDNGRACGDAVSRSRENGGGHGLSGLAERLSLVDGTVDAGPLPEGGFLLKVTAKTPVKKRVEASRDEPIPGVSSAARPWAGMA